MIKFYGTLIFWSLISYGAAIDKEVKPSEPPVPLVPFTKMEDAKTFWNLFSPKGSRVILECRFHTTTKKKVYVKVNTGKKLIVYTPEKYEKGFRTTSYRNHMQVGISNFGLNPMLTCHVIATPLYTELTVPDVDSSEFGQSRFAKKKKADCKCGWTNKSLQRIVGGVEAGINEYPFVAILKYVEYGKSFCGGTIISSRHVLTAAHCLYERLTAKMCVTIGEHDLLSRTETTATRDILVIQKIIHEYYDVKSAYNDIAMVVLMRDIIFSVRIGPVCLPDLNQRTLPDTLVKAMGWGFTKYHKKGGHRSNVLRKVNLRVIDPEICNQIFETVPRTTICTYNSHKDVCHGDSGGPLVTIDPQTNMYKLVGIISYGYHCGSTNPSISTNVEHYLDWIKEVIDETVPAEICY